MKISVGNKVLREFQKNKPYRVSGKSSFLYAISQGRLAFS